MHVVVLVLENHQGEVLLTQRQPGKHLAGFWEFPGGKVEATESNLAALQRECQEELSYCPTSPQLILTLDHTYDTHQVCLHVFHELANKPSVTAAEQQAMQWLHKSKLDQIKLPPANSAITNHLNRLT